MTSKGESVTLESVIVEKDLGVNVDSDLRFSKHVSIQVQKANRLLSLIRRGFPSLDSVSLPLLYKSIIRPHIEYGNVVWHPRYKGDEQQLENVQRRATKLIPELRDLDYSERLRRLDLPSLYYRRARGDMIECFKYLTGIYKTKSDILHCDTQTQTRGHSFKLKKTQVSSSVRQNFFSVRVVNAWNSLSEQVVSAPTLNAFKDRLDKLWKNFKFSQDSEWFKQPKPAPHKHVKSVGKKEEEFTSH